MKKQLPKYYCIKRDESNPLWKNYDKWIRNNGYNPISNDWDYVGYDGCNTDNGYNGTRKISSFCNPVTLITLEFWDECVNGRKIVGYKAPFDLTGGNKAEAKKGDIYVKHERNSCLYVPKKTRESYLSVPKEIVETWEAVYEEEKFQILDWKYYAYEYYTEIKIKGKLTQEIVDKIKEVINESN